MGRRAFTHKGLFQAVCRHFYVAGSDVKAISVAVLCGDAEWPQEMGPLSDSRALEPDSAAPADADGCCFIRQEGGSVLSHRGTVFVFHISPGALPLKCESLAHNRH